MKSANYIYQTRQTEQPTSRADTAPVYGYDRNCDLFDDGEANLSCDSPNAMGD